MCRLHCHKEIKEMPNQGYTKHLQRFCDNSRSSVCVDIQTTTILFIVSNYGRDSQFV